MSPRSSTGTVATKVAAPTQPPAPARSTSGAASSASSTSSTPTAAQLAKETINQLQTQANKGNKAAMRELQRRERLKQEPAADSKGTGETEAGSPQEAGKGTQIDKKA